ncbi:hypothetical protein MVEN_00344500 [Mycena venus]|uniref:Uncharacterized protein n=1 Tax=Mycena venus TaxID=2733690 RepID=A0A8H6YUW0_9AGAR|nr:hypothetical protein MVEN_00344500 [Mycena venus]
MKDLSSHALIYLVLVIVAAIPNHTLRYIGLALIIVLILFCTIQLRSPSTQLHHLATVIDDTDVLIRHAMARCPRDYFTLTEQMGRLLEASKSASLIKCRILNSQNEGLSWNKYRVLAKDIEECRKRVKSICTEVKLIMEAELQHKLENDIKQTQFILASSQTTLTAPQFFAYCV